MFFTFFFLSIFSCLCVKIPKTHKKVENPKCLIGIIVLCHMHVLPCTFVQMALCIYDFSLFFMYLYHCGKNLNIYVIVVNRSSNLSWMISQWFCWSWDLHRLVPIYLSTLLFFCLKSSTNVKSQKVIMSCKSRCTYQYLTRKRGKWLVMKMYGA